MQRLLLAIEAEREAAQATKLQSVSAGQALFDALYATGGRPLLANGGQVLKAEFSPNVRTLATIMNDETIHLWDLTVADLGAESFALGGDTGQFNSLTYSPDGKFIVTGSYDGTASIWDPETGVELVRLWDRAGDVSQATWSQDGTKILFVGDDDTAQIWDAATGTELVKLAGHTKPVTQATWSRDESTILTTSADDTVRRWDAVTGEEVSKLLLDLKGATPVLSPDQRWLAAGLGDGTVLLWQLASAESAGTSPIALSGHGARSWLSHSVPMANGWPAAAATNPCDYGT